MLFKLIHTYGCLELILGSPLSECFTEIHVKYLPAKKGKPVFYYCLPKSKVHNIFLFETKLICQHVSVCMSNFKFHALLK